MTIKIPYRSTNINIDTSLNGDLEISFTVTDGMPKAILESIYEEIDTDDLIKTLDYAQIQEISEYFETIKGKKW